MLRDMAMLGRKRLLSDRICGWCKRNFQTKRKGKHTARFCSRSCAVRYSMGRPDVRAKISKANSRIWWFICEWCGKEFFRHQSKHRRFCNRSCSARWRMSRPDYVASLDTKIRGEHISEGLRKAHQKNPNLARASSIRMKIRNPTSLPGVAEKISKALKGRQLPFERGGNGKLTIPQMRMKEMLGWPAEVPIPTKIKNWTRVVPDLVCLDAKIALEMDGLSHNTRRQRIIDRKKEYILASLGYTVVRVPNHLASEQTASWLKLLALDLKDGKIQQSTILKQPQGIILLQNT